ncbi:hypothetical protein KIN20_035045 [Parelaphostrongylus tenuis]|uniref:Uncharacterized protein n=1 Tax=Parelaphostrongylus tenuis TaxID=148309 RepID=A0AAD5WKH9_PARTN|nr:hypothetical protein KIN20_035045 [Parelaphostrongylus tenuis]
MALSDTSSSAKSTSSSNRRVYEKKTVEMVLFTCNMQRGFMSKRHACTVATDLTHNDTAGFLTK